jgi:hypothetical protein
MNEPTNSERAARIDATLESYVIAREDGPDDPEFDLANMLADIMHYCERDGIDFDVALTRAAEFYSEERNQ